MKKQANWIVVLILILALSGLACNAILGDDAEPTAESTTIEPAVTAPTGSGGEGSGDTGSETSGGILGGAAPTLDLNPENNFGIPSDVNSFRISLDMEFEETKADGTVENGHITATGAQVLEPFAIMLDFTFEGTDIDLNFGAAGFSMTQIGDITYVNLAETGCISTSGNEFDSPFTSFASSGTFLGGVQGATLVEENVSINGVPTNHYRFDESALTQEEQPFGTLENVDGHIYISTEEGYLVRLTVEAVGQNLNLDMGEDSFGGSDDINSGHIMYQIDYSDFNAPIEITEPVGCAGAEDTEYPILSDATDFNSFGDVLNYNTTTAFTDIVDFYKTEMAAAGYTLDSEFVSDPTAVLTFSQDGENVSVSVLENPNGDGYTVVITKG